MTETGLLRCLLRSSFATRQSRREQGGSFITQRDGKSSAEGRLVTPSSLGKFFQKRGMFQKHSVLWGRIWKEMFNS